MEKIGLIATQIIFKKHSIVYKVKPFKGILIDKVIGKVVFCNNDIQDKDLMMRPTMLTKENMEVIFVSVNATCDFYFKIFRDPTSKMAQEHLLEKKDIYNVGEVVGYVVA